jgi:hypothetical protein
MKKTKHIGFKKAAESVARREGVNMEHARAIIAAGARNASKMAKAANPRLARVKG